MGFGRYLLCPDYKLSLTSVGTLVRLPYLGIVDPIRSPFVPYGVINTAGNKLRIGDGFPSCTWDWGDAAMTREMSSRLQAYLGGQQSAFVYFRTTNNDESAFANYYGVLQLPVLVPSGYGVSAFEPVVWQFNALVAQ